MYGPNGIGCFRLIIFDQMSMVPTSAPNNDARKNVSKTLASPSMIPSTPNNFISPAPIPPLLTIMMTASRTKPITLPVIDECHGVSGFIIRMMMKSGKKKSNTLFGMSIYLTSVTKRIINIDINNNAVISSTVKPNL